MYVHVAGIRSYDLTSATDALCVFLVPWQLRLAGTTASCQEPQMQWWEPQMHSKHLVVNVCPPSCSELVYLQQSMVYVLVLRSTGLTSVLERLREQDVVRAARTKLQQKTCRPTSVYS